MRRQFGTEGLHAESGRGRPSGIGVPEILKVHFLRFPTCYADQSPNFLKVHLVSFPTFCSANWSPLSSESAFVGTLDVLLCEIESQNV